LVAARAACLPGVHVLPLSTDLWTFTSENGRVRKKHSCATKKAWSRRL
jgi:hypothetical protein